MSINLHPYAAAGKASAETTVRVNSPPAGGSIVVEPREAGRRCELTQLTQADPS